MNKKLSFGKLPSLPRVKSSYRQLQRKLIPIICWVAALFLLAGNVSATYTPTNVADLLSVAKPIMPIKNQLPPQPVTVASTSNPAETSQPSVTATLTDQPTDKPTPEISMEIKAAEYIPPTPKLVIRTVLSTNDGFPFGQCTYYVATKRSIPWGGNAGQWYYEAQAYGFKVGSAPAVGAIMVSYEGNPSGHVSYMERLNSDGSFTVSEMNYAGAWGMVTYRTLRLGDTYIVGFIY